MIIRLIYIFYITINIYIEIFKIKFIIKTIRQSYYQKI